MARVIGINRGGHRDDGFEMKIKDNYDDRKMRRAERELKFWVWFFGIMVFAMISVIAGI